MPKIHWYACIIIATEKIWNCENNNTKSSTHHDLRIMTVQFNITQSHQDDMANHRVRATQQITAIYHQCSPPTWPHDNFKTTMRHISPHQPFPYPLRCAPCRTLATRFPILWHGGLANWLLVMRPVTGGELWKRGQTLTYIDFAKAM